jgi:hypothetical protein
LTTADAEPWRLERDMSTTEAEFLRGLRLAAPVPVTVLADGSIRLDHDGVTLIVRLSPNGERVIAGLALPRLHAEYELAGPRDAASRLLEQLDLAMRRGGG